MMLPVHYLTKLRNTSFLAIVLLLPFFSQAQPLADLIDSAMVHQPGLQALEQEYLAALERAPQVNQLPNPEIGIGGFPLPVETRLGPQWARLGATQAFPWPGTLPKRGALEDTKAKALYEQIEARALELRYELEEAYFQLYEIRQRQAILKRNLPLLKSLESITLAKVASGKASTADVLRVQIRVEELQQEIKISEQTALRPLSVINRLLQRAPAAPVKTENELTPAPLPFRQDSLLEVIRRTHPSLQQLGWQQEAARQTVALNDLEGKPSFGLGADYIFVGQRNDAAPNANGRDIIQLRASIRLPIYREKYEAKAREERLRINALENRKVDLQHYFQMTVAQAYADYETAQLRLQMYDQQRQLTQAAIQVLEDAYSTQGRSFDELLQLEAELIDYDLKRLRALVASHLAVAKIRQFLWNKNTE